ncbi:MAG: TfoX/Sxy family protein [Bauldia sp.]
MIDGLVEQLVELCEPVGGVSHRKMFGGVGFFREGIMFALIADGRFYLRADAENEPSFVAEGCPTWSYAARDRVMTMPYRLLPERLFDEPEEFVDWALKAFAAAVRAKSAATRPRKTKRKVG